MCACVRSQAGDVGALKKRLEALAAEAETEGERRARGTAEARDSRGCTLLMIAAENDDADMVRKRARESQA